MNRELRRLQEKEEKRSKQSRQQRAQQRMQRKERVSPRQFFREVRQELRRVAWPSRQELTTFTLVTVITTTVLTGIIFGMDFLFKESVLWVLELGLD